MSQNRCPVCGKKNENGSATCDGCGYSFKEAPRCPECGHIVPEEIRTCPFCGCPLMGKESLNRDLRKFGNILFFLVVVMNFAWIGIATMDHAATVEPYLDESGETVAMMQEQREILDECSGMLLNTWQNAEQKVSDPKTDPYTKSNGVFVSDSALAVKTLYRDPKIVAEHELLMHTGDELVFAKEDFRHPPEKYRAYNKVLLAYTDCYLELVSTVLEPKGTYPEIRDSLKQDYQELNHLEEELDQAYERTIEK